MHPPPPWQLTGDLWLSLFAVSGVAGRAEGIYAAAFVHYVAPSPLTYHELLVARIHRQGRFRGAAHVTDIWVDDPDSRAGGRELWALPKELADFELRQEDGRRVRRTTWRATRDGTVVATAAFSDASHLAPRTPLGGRTRQHRPDGTPVTAPFRGSGHTLPARGRWRFTPEGPLGWLAGRRSLGTVRVSDFSMSFG